MTPIYNLVVLMGDETKFEEIMERLQEDIDCINPEVNDNKLFFATRCIIPVCSVRSVSLDYPDVIFKYSSWCNYDYRAMSDFDFWEGKILYAKLHGEPNEGDVQYIRLGDDGSMIYRTEFYTEEEYECYCY